MNQTELREAISAHNNALIEIGLPSHNCWGWGAIRIQNAGKDQRCSDCDRKLKVVSIYDTGDARCASCAFGWHLENGCLVGQSIGSIS